MRLAAYGTDTISTTSPLLSSVDYAKYTITLKSYCYTTPLPLSVLSDTTWHKPAELPVLPLQRPRFVDSIGVDSLRISLTKFYIDGIKYLGLVRQQKIFCLEYYVRGESVDATSKVFATPPSTRLIRWDSWTGERSEE